MKILQNSVLSFSFTADERKTLECAYKICQDVYDALDERLGANEQLNDINGEPVMPVFSQMLDSLGYIIEAEDEEMGVVKE